MKRKNKKQNKILPVVLVLIGLVAVAGMVFAAFKLLNLDKLFNQDTTHQNTTSNTSDQRVITREPNPSSSAEPQSNPQQGYQEKEPVVQYSGDNPNDADRLSGAITYTGISNDTFIIRVNIDQYVREGNCILTVTGAKTSYTEAARVTDAASTSTCEGFNVPLSVIKDSNVDILIEIKADDKQGVIRGNASI